MRGKLKLTKPELMKFDPRRTISGSLETNKGNIKIKLMPGRGPDARHEHDLSDDKASTIIRCSTA